MADDSCNSSQYVGRWIQTTLCILSLFIGIQFENLHAVSFPTYFETINPLYEPISGKSTSSATPIIKISFTAFRRSFILLLRPVRQGVLSSDLEVDVFYEGNHVSHLTSSYVDSVLQMVEGREQEDDFSQVRGSISERKFLGLILTNNVTYNVQTVNGTQVISRDFDLSMAESWFKCDRNHIRKGFPNFTHTKEEGFHSFIRPLPALNKRDLLGFKTVCTLKLFSDHTFYLNFSDRTIAGVIQTMVTIVDAVDTIFKNTNFAYQEREIRTRLQVVKMEINTGINSGTYRFYKDETTAIDFLSLFTGYYFADVCLGIAFVSRIFTDGSIGISYPYDPDVLLPGGVCQQRAKLLGQGEESSFNVAVVSLLSPYGEPLSHEVNVVNLAHQIGHSFGSDHDDPQDKHCSSKGQDGRFIMSPTTATGLQSNNMKYSECSIRKMAEVMVAVEKSCFQRAQSICGNGVTEPGEKCDCGVAEQCHLVDNCCTPELLMEDSVGCRLTDRAVCSPRESYCCTDSCVIVSAYMRKDCTKGNECLMPAICPGNDTECLPPRLKPEGTSCQEGRGRCRNGLCEDVACGYIGLEPCKCTSPKDACQLCCYKGQLCLPYVRWGSPHDRKHYFRPNGEKCLQGKGFCINGECRIGYSQDFINYEEDFVPLDVEPPKSPEYFSPYILIAICVAAVLGTAVVLFLLITCVMWVFGYSMFTRVHTVESRVRLQGTKVMPGMEECRFPNVKAS